MEPKTAVATSLKHRDWRPLAVLVCGVLGSAYNVILNGIVPILSVIIGGRSEPYVVMIFLVMGAYFFLLALPGLIGALLVRSRPRLSAMLIGLSAVLWGWGSASNLARPQDELLTTVVWGYLPLAAALLLAIAAVLAVSLYWRPASTFGQTRNGVPA